MDINIEKEFKSNNSLFKYCKDQLFNILNKLNYYESLQDLGSRKLGVFKYLKNLLLNLDVMQNLSNSDSIASFLTINRMIIDSYSVFYLIAFHSSIQERNIRYYMYLIDGIKTRTKTVREFESKAFNSVKLNKDIRTLVYEQDTKSIRLLTELIKNENTNNYVCDEIIQANNWKFINPKNFNSIKKNSYSWLELYKLAKIPEHYSISFQNYYSTFVHGLGTTLLTNTNYDKMPIICASLNLTSIIQSIIIKIILIEYKDELLSFKLDSQFEKYIDLHWDKWSQLQN